jgi:hypothetical protein
MVRVPLKTNSLDELSRAPRAGETLAALIILAIDHPPPISRNRHEHLPPS